jgi:hypothetical protein
MNQFMKTTLTFGLLVALLFGLYFFANWFSQTTGYALGEDEKVKLAQCLDGKEAVFYTSDTCPLCETQENLFGQTSMRFLEVIVCQNEKDCPEGGVPAWKIFGKTYYGFKDFNQLIEISGCRVE